MEHGLLCPNQARMNNVVIDDVPKHLDFRQLSHHSVWFPDDDVELPLDLKGPISYLHVRYPTDEDMEFCTELELTSIDDWEPELCQTTQRGDLVNVSQFSLHPYGLQDPCELNDFDTMLYGTLTLSGVTHSRTSDITAEQLSRLWAISLENAKRTIRATDQESIRILEGKITRRIKTGTNSWEDTWACSVQIRSNLMLHP